MTQLPNAADAIPIVLNTSDRGIRFALPNTNQRVYNLGTQYVERWTGGAWVQDIPFGSITGGQTFTGGTVPNPTTFSSTSVFGAGIQIAGPLFGSTGTIDLQTNSTRANRVTSLSLNGPASDGSQDVNLINGANGTFQVNTNGAVGGGYTLQINSTQSFLNSAFAVLGTSFTLYGSTSIVNANRTNGPALQSFFGPNSVGAVDVQAGNDGTGNFVTVNGSNTTTFMVDPSGNITVIGAATVAGLLNVTGVGTFTAGVALQAVSTTVAPGPGDSSTNIPTTAWVNTAIAGGGGAASNPFLVNSGRAATASALSLEAAASGNDVYFNNNNNGQLTVYAGGLSGTNMFQLNPAGGTFLNFGPQIQHSAASSGGVSLYIDMNQGRVQTTGTVGVRFKGATVDGILAYGATTSLLSWITTGGTVLTVDVNGNITSTGTAGSSFAGPVTGVTASNGDNTTKFSTTAWVNTAIAGAISGGSVNPFLINSARAAGTATLTLEAALSANDISFINNGTGQLSATSGANSIFTLFGNAGGTLNYGCGLNHPSTTISAASLYWDLNLSRLQTTSGVGLRFKTAASSTDGVLMFDATTGLFTVQNFTNGALLTVDVTGNLTVTKGGTFGASVTGVTEASSDNSNKYASTAYVTNAVAAVTGGTISNPLVVNSGRGSSTATLTLQGSTSANDATFVNNGTTASILLGSAGTLFSVANGAGAYLQYGYAVDRPYSGTNWSQWNKSRIITTGTYYLEVLGASTSQDTYLQFNAGTGSFGIATGGNTGAPQFTMDSSGNVTMTGLWNVQNALNISVPTGNINIVTNANRTTNAAAIQFCASSTANDTWLISNNTGSIFFAATAAKTPTFSVTAAGVASVSLGGSYQVNTTQVVTARQTGWTAATGTATRTSFATGSVTLPNLAQAVKALIDDLLTHGLIGT